MRCRLLINEAFQEAFNRYPELRVRWVRLSFNLAKYMPQSPLLMTAQRAGNLDLLIRGLEDDYLPQAEGEPPDFALDYLTMLSELWIGHVYEIFRIIKNMDGISDDIKNLEKDLRLLRIPLEKYEIASDHVLETEVLELDVVPMLDESVNPHPYQKGSYVMPRGLSDKGSVMWCTIDLKSRTNFWIDRRLLSDRIINLINDDNNGSPPARG